LEPRIKYTAPDKLPHWDTEGEFSLLIFDMNSLYVELQKHPITHVTASDLALSHRRALEQALKNHQPIGMPIIRLTKDVEMDDMIDFFDGRHRTEFLHENGIKEMPAVVLTGQRDRMIAMGVAREPTPQEEHAIKTGLAFQYLDNLYRNQEKWWR